MPQEPTALPDESTPHVLVTGVTGFLGQALLERLLSGTDARVSVVIRPRGARTGADRLIALLGKSVFEPWVARLGKEAALRRLTQRVHVLEGDLRDLPPLPTDLDAVVHSASSVSFDDPIDMAFTTNVGGPFALYRAMSEAGGQTANAHVVHVSTSYVSTGRHEVAPEQSLAHDVDWRAELSRALEMRARLFQDHMGNTELVELLRAAGRERARELGWTDVYTMTKALGERVAEELWAGRGRPLTVLRPTIIESALRHPFPGWIDGFKVADPLIAAYAQGRLLGFPGRPESVLDVIPVDFVVNAALAALRDPPGAGGSRYLQIGSGTSNPLTLGELRLWVQDYFRNHPWIDRDGNPVLPQPWEFSEPAALDRWVSRRQGALRGSAAVLDLLPHGWLGAPRTAVRSGLRQLEAMRGFMELYQPYTCATTTYDDARIRALLARQSHPRDTFDVMAIDWQRYLTQAHLPALVAIMQGRTSTTRRPSAVTSMRGHRGQHGHRGRGRRSIDDRGAQGAAVHAVGA